jgi:putative MFS transporter
MPTVASVSEQSIVARLERLPASRWRVKIRTIVGTATFFDAFVYTPEIYPTRSRAIGSSIATSWQRTGAIVGPLFVSFALPSFGLGSVFLVFAGAALVAALIVIFFVTETNGQVLEELSP